MQPVTRSLTRITTTLALAASLVPAMAANWPQWRGPAFNGSSPEQNLPTKFSKTENVRWTADMPGASAATPVVWNDRVFVSSSDSRQRNLQALCLDAKTGEILWQHKMSDSYSRDNRSNYASPSPVTDGEMVWFYCGDAELAAFDFNGKEVWRRNIQKDYGEFAMLWTYGTSPLLYDGKLYIQVLQRDVPVSGRGRTDAPNDPYLLALDPATGKTLWRVVRPSEARAESREAFSTPIPVGVGAKVEILITGGDCITGHDPQSGLELWRWGTYNPTRIGHWRLVPSPVGAGGNAILCAPKGAPVYAIKLGLRGTLNDSAITWESSEREVSSDVATPLVYQGKLFLLNGERKSVSRLDPATGKVDWTGELGTRTKIESSPTGADGKLYFLDHSGRVFVVSAGDEFEVLHQVEMGDDSDRDTRSSIAVANGNLFIRTAGKLYCIEE